MASGDLKGIDHNLAGAFREVFGAEGLQIKFHRLLKVSLSLFDVFALAYHPELDTMGYIPLLLFRDNSGKFSGHERLLKGRFYQHSPEKTTPSRISA